jgi:hypothetical protein
MARLVGAVTVIASEATRSRGTQAPYVPLDRRVAKARLKDGLLSTPYGSSR